ncbi:MAG: DUF1311 domain-containing protein [Thermoanaerobaculia bacterium]|nr:DUF1311 domain-containing protein [Thermoanaerobaculia bacterium]
MRAILLTLCAMALTTSLHAGEPSPIDRNLEACIDRDPSTAGMVECIDEAFAAWDEELNAAYQAVAKLLTREQRDALKTAQRQWLAWRDAEFAMLDAIYATREGTMYLPMAAGDRMEVVKARAVELRGYESLLKIDG